MNGMSDRFHEETKRNNRAHCQSTSSSSQRSLLRWELSSKNSDYPLGSQREDLDGEVDGREADSWESEEVSVIHRSQKDVLSDFGRWSNEFLRERTNEEEGQFEQSEGGRVASIRKRERSDSLLLEEPGREEGFP